MLDAATMGGSDRGTDDETEMLESILETESAVSLRQFVREHLDVRNGASVLSIGCGPGYEQEAFAADVGEGGRVHGIDTNGAVLAAARERCQDRPQCSWTRGDATRLPVADASFDVVVAKQVLQFVPDVEAALGELWRVLEPGGRAAVVEGDVDAMVFNTSDRERMRRALDAYRSQSPHPHLGSRLTGLLQEAGFSVEGVEPHTWIHREITERVERGIEAHRRFMTAHDSFDTTEIDAWERDLRELDEAGEFFHAGTQFLYVARKPE